MTGGAPHIAARTSARCSASRRPRMRARSRSWSLLSLVAFLPGFFNIPPIDRDEARFAQATKQMIESGDYVDIRYQDEVRYKKPVGIYWLQAGVVNAAEAVGVPQARTTIWLYRIPSLLGAIGAVLLTYWAALAFVSRRMAYLAGLMMATSVLLDRRGAPRQDRRRCCSPAASPPWAVMARAYLTQSTGRDIGWGQPLILWTALAAGILLKGPLILMVVGLAAALGRIADRSARWLMRLRPLVGVLWVLLLVLPWFVAIMARAGDSFFAGIGRAGPARQDLPGAGNPRRAARLLPAAVLADLLAGRTARRDGGAGGLAAAARAAAALPARLAGAELDRVRARGHQAAALRAAALSGDRDPDRARRSSAARCRRTRIWCAPT